jgi:ADP-ribosylglycohydrolase
MDPARYEEQVYAGVLGKVIGVYMGRPFEGMRKPDVVAHWGLVDRYVADERKVPLVVPDDDITGTFTFVRALEDSGRVAETTAADVGQAWLNYIAEHRTILWWGGLGVSTEHTAFLRLQDGIAPPRSGSAELNGQVVAEQIGAQIFIEGFGLVAPGRPELAARLAQRAATVSHDGEAVHGAKVVAAMTAAAFTEKDVDRLLDLGVSVIPPGCLIAQVHREVRAWCREDRDWHRTYERIAARYGYDRYGGGCHIIPNHAIMVMAWAYAEGSFRRAQAIINTAGWDTDCNAANVGSVMGLVVGLEGINREYDFQAPFADRLIMPTAEGTRSATDCLAEALHIARAGRRIMGWPALPAPKEGAAFHFCLPQSRQGFLAERSAHGMAGTATTVNIAGADGARRLAVDWREASDRHPVLVSTPLLHEPAGGGYGIMGCSRVAGGQTVTLHGLAESGGARVRLFLRHYEPATRKPTGMAWSEPVTLAAGGAFTLAVTAPDAQGWPVADLGLAIDGAAVSGGRLLIDRIAIGGNARIALPDALPRSEHGLLGWVADAEVIAQRGGIRKDRGRAVAVTGTADWRDYAVASTVSVHCGELGGLVARYQGLQRYLLLAKTCDALRLVLRFDGEETVLAERACRWAVDEPHRLELAVRGTRVAARCDGAELFAVEQERLAGGGAGFAVETGLLHFADTAIIP